MCGGGRDTEKYYKITKKERHERNKTNRDLRKMDLRLIDFSNAFRVDQMKFEYKDMHGVLDENKPDIYLLFGVESLLQMLERLRKGNKTINDWQNIDKANDYSVQAKQVFDCYDWPKIESQLLEYEEKKKLKKKAKKDKEKQLQQQLLTLQTQTNADIIENQNQNQSENQSENVNEIKNEKSKENEIKETPHREQMEVMQTLQELRKDAKAGNV